MRISDWSSDVCSSDLERYLDRAATANGTNSVWPFIVGLAQSASDLDALWDAAYARFVATDRGHPGLSGGLLEGARVRHRDWVERKLDACVTVPALSERSEERRLGKVCQYV